MSFPARVTGVHPASVLLVSMGSLMDEEHSLQFCRGPIRCNRDATPNVYNLQGEKLGTVHSVMIHKTSGHVEYALLAFGGFFGIGTHVHPIPWQMLTYDSARHGYVANITREMLEDAPSLELDKAARPTESERPMYSFWKFDPYW